MQIYLKFKYKDAMDSVISKVWKMWKVAEHSLDPCTKTTAGIKIPQEGLSNWETEQDQLSYKEDDLS